MSDSEHKRLLWLDELCDRFESAWATEKQFSIEFVLENISDEKAPIALKSLLELERDFRANSDKPLSDHEMLRRFPNQMSIIDSVAQNLGLEDSLQSAAETLAPQSADPPTGVRIPQEMGRYHILRKLGQGAMGSVFLANDEQLGRKVALKIPRGDVQRDAELRTRFEREARAVAALDHPNICRIYDVGEFEGIHYICMGYIEGFSLSRFAIAESGLSEQRIAEIVIKLAKALAAAHEAGFIHRDLKPANVMIDHNDEPVILDFGLARRIDPNKDTRVTQTGANVGSPAYMSPEQVDGDQEKIGLQTDVYSLGVILYELLTGRLPFEGSMASVMGQIMMKKPDKPSDYRRELSVRLENICVRMLEKDCTKRHPSMHAVAADLREYLDRFSDRNVVAAPVIETDSTDVGAKRRQQIEGLIKSRDYGPAEKLLAALSRETEDALLDAASWAAAQLPQLRKTREEVRAGRQDIYNTASRLMKSSDYEQASRLLDEYPYDLRTPRMQELLERADLKSNQVKRLRNRIKELRNRGDNGLLLQSLNHLLELKPADRRAKELREKLINRSNGPISKLLGRRKPSFMDRTTSAVEWLLLVLLVVFASAYPAYRWSSDYLAQNEQNDSPASPPSWLGSAPPSKLESESPTEPNPSPDPATASDSPHPYFVSNTDFRGTETLDGGVKHMSMHVEGYQGNGHFDVTLFLHSMQTVVNEGENNYRSNRFFGVKYAGRLTVTKEGEVTVASTISDDFQRHEGDAFQVGQNEQAWNLTGKLAATFTANGVVWTPYDRSEAIDTIRKRFPADSVLLVHEFQGGSFAYDARLEVNNVSETGFSGHFIYDNARDLNSGNVVNERRGWVTHEVDGSFCDDGSVGLVFGKRLRKADGANAPEVAGRSDVLWIFGNKLIGANFKVVPTPLTEGKWEHSFWWKLRINKPV